MRPDHIDLSSQSAQHAEGTSTMFPTRAPGATKVAIDEDDGLAGASDRISTSRLYLMVLSDFGLAFTWVVKYAMTTPYLTHVLRAGVVTSHAVWVLGPLSGLVTAPVVGVLSDRCRSRFGRRRPFMAGGALACVTGMALFASADLLPQRAQLPVAVIGFGALDFASNVVQFPSRALLGDLLPPARQHDAQSAAAVLASLAEISAGAFLFALREPLAYVRLAFAAASIILLITTFVSLRVCVEVPLHAGPPDIEMEEVVEGADEQRGAAGPSRTSSDIEEEKCDDEQDGSFVVDGPLKTDIPRSVPVWREIGSLVTDAICNFPRALVPVGVVYGLAWLCWYASLPWFSAWLGDSVMRGSSTAPVGSAKAILYQKGITLFGVASIIKALVSLAFSAIYPWLLGLGGRKGEALMFSTPFIVFGIALAVVARTHSAIIAGAVVVMAGIPFVATQTIPIAIVVQRFPDRLASNLGVLCVSFALRFVPSSCARDLTVASFFIAVSC